MVSAENIFILSRGGKDNDRDDIAFRMSAQPFKNIEPGAAGHFQISDEKTGKGVFGAVLVVAFPLEVVDRILAVWARVKRILKAVPLKSVFQQQNIVGIVLGDQNGQATLHVG